MGKKISKSNRFFKQAIIFFGFLNGLWIAIGIDPEKIIRGVLQPFVEKLGSQAIYLFGILPTILLGISLYLIYKKGRLMGLIAVLCGFAGGLLILASPIVSVIFLIAAWAIGYFSVN